MNFLGFKWAVGAVSKCWDGRRPVANKSNKVEQLSYEGVFIGRCTRLRNTFRTSGSGARFTAPREADQRKRSKPMKQQIPSETGADVNNQR